MFTEHAGEAGGSSEELDLVGGGGNVGEVVSAAEFELGALVEVGEGFRIGRKLAEAGDRQFSLVLEAEVEKEFDEIGLDGVVGVDECDKITGGKIESGVASAGKAAVLLVDDLDAGVFLSEDIAKLLAHVSGAIVDEDDFEVFVSLSKDGINAALEDFGDVVDRDDDGNERIEAGLRGCLAIGGGFGLGGM